VSDRTSPTVDVPGLVEQAIRGQPRAVARLITLVEDGHPALREVMAALAAQASNRPGNRPAATVIGLTGPPGVGKSTATSALIAAFRALGRRVGVLAVDPSSPFSGGALLGDRIRMHEHTMDDGVYIRSMATRGHLGGLARSTPQASRVLAAAGCDVVLIETVGVGQSEVEIAGLADTTVVMSAPGMGDGIQAAKAGLLEIGDVFVVNKADAAGAAATSRDLRQMIGLADRPAPDAWRPPVLQTVASTGQGIGELVAALERHRGWLIETGWLERRQRRRAAVEIEAIALARLQARIGRLPPGARLDDLAEDVVNDRADPYRCADIVLAELAAELAGEQALNPLTARPNRDKA
jgi:LAO/AO transport system kinase